VITPKLLFGNGVCTVLLGQSYGFAGPLSQVVQLRAFGFAAAQRSDVEDIGTMQREDTLNTFVADDSANCEHLVYATTLAGDDSAGEDLYPLLVALDNPAMYIYRITDFEMRNLVLEALAFDRI